MAFSLARNERLFLQDQSAIRTIPNSSGTATVAGSDACRFIRASFDNDIALIDRPDKTGTRTATAGTAGRKFSRWSVEASLVTSGAAGTVPDWDPILKALMGQAGSVGSGSVSIVSTTNAAPIAVTATAHGLSTGDSVFISGADDSAANGAWIVNVSDANTFTLIGSTGTSVGGANGTVSKVNVAYSLSDSILSFAGWSFRTPSGLAQRCSFGNVVQECTFTLGEDVPRWVANGEGIWTLDSIHYSSADTVQQGGLSAFPSEPGSPTTAGGLIPGFIGRIVVNGNMELGS
jgi:hypothetical protein